MRIALIIGGVGAEREVSLHSGAFVKELLQIPNEFVIDWQGDVTVINSLVGAVDVVIPMIHGIGGEDGQVQEILDKLNIPYIFSAPESHQQSLDKKRAKELVATTGLNMAQESPGTFPQFIKPRFGGSSVDSSLIQNQSELNEFIRLHPETEFITEELITGQEMTVGVIDRNQTTSALAVIEIIPPDKFFDYDSKYTDGKMAEEICPANIDPELTKQLQQFAIHAHQSLGLKHLSRSDFIVTADNDIYYLETNTIPGFTKNSLVPKELRQANIDIKNLFLEWCNEVHYTNYDTLKKT